MINFNTIDKTTFLKEYWQKKPLLIKQALTNFKTPLSRDELAGLALEKDIESRLIIETPNAKKPWQLTAGPFTEETLTQLPLSHWTLLIQGVDRVIPEIAALRDQLDIIPAWRFDDVMISIAPNSGSVGPHYDNYDVFLYQAEGRRVWSLTSQNCNEGNYLEDCDLRIMKSFIEEQRYVLEAGDMLYLPAHIGHHGVSLSDDCMTYSFGYRSYQTQELWDSFGDSLSEMALGQALVADPDWSSQHAAAEISQATLVEVKKSLLSLIDDDKQLTAWFARFATQLDVPALDLVEAPLTNEEAGSLSDFVLAIKQGATLTRHPVCRMAYYQENNTLHLVINSDIYSDPISDDLIKRVANQPRLDNNTLLSLIDAPSNQQALYQLWRQQFLIVN